MIGDVGRLFTKLLHLEDPWAVESVNVNDDETRVDIRVSVKTVPKIVCDCGCTCICHDRREREWQHSDLFDMECHIRCRVPRMKCPGCGKMMLLDVPWA